MNDKKFQKKLEKIKKRSEQYKQEYELKATYEKYVPEKKKKKVSNVMLVVIVFAIVGYTIANFILQYCTGAEISPTITTCWFAFWSAEILALMGIKITKTRHEVDETQYDWTDKSDESEM